MYRKIAIVLMLLSLLFMFSGCMSHAVKTDKTELDQLRENDFKGFAVPEISKIKQRGGSKDYPYVTFDNVWNSVIIVLIQKRFIVRSSKNTGIIVADDTPPLVVFVEKGDVMKLYLHWMENLYRKIDKPEEPMFNFSSSYLRVKTDSFFDELSNQLYAGEKWKYLYKETPK